jgi:N-acetylmuramoyl-L-alanine amidase
MLSKFQRTLLIALLAFLAFSIHSNAEEFNKILKLESVKLGDYAEVAVYTSMNVQPEIIILDSPNRIALAFPNSRIDSSITIPSRSPLITMVQALQFDDNTVYVMIEPKEELTYTFASLVGRKKFILELTKAKPGAKKKVAPSPKEEPQVISAVPSIEPGMAQEIASSEANPEEVTLASTTLEPVEISAEAVPVVATEEVVPTVPTKEVVATKEVEILTSEETAASKEAAVDLIKKTPSKPFRKTKAKAVKTPPPLKGMIIVIDPGHGGRDPGYVGRTGILEKRLTYRVALRLKQILNDAGAKVFLTRNGDTEIKNREIVEFANSKNADLFLALHFNSFTSSRIRGCTTFYFTPQSKRFARTLEKNVARTTGLKDRGVKRETYYVAHHTTMPSLIIEAGYLTNPRDEKLILNPQFRQQIALGICKGIKEYAKITSIWRKFQK